MIRVRLINDVEFEFDDGIAKWDTVVLQVVQDGKRWTFPLSAVACFITEEPTP